MASKAGLLLTWVGEDGERSRLLGDADVRLGRGHGADVCISDKTVSEIHCTFRREASGWLVEDCKSTNGTWVNCSRIGVATQIRDGDRIECGATAIYVSQVDTTEVVTCPNCSKKLRVPESANSLTVSCPNCQTAFSHSNSSRATGSPPSVEGQFQPPSAAATEQTTLLANTALQLDELAHFLKAAHPNLSGLSKHCVRLGLAASRGLTIMVVGPFNVGKSTLLNCILGREMLPADVTPTTAIPTRILFGAAESLCVRTRSGKSMARNLSELSALVQASDEGVVEAELRVPVAELKYVELIDSPGLHALDQTHTDSTYSAHDNVDAVLWVTTCAQSASAGEADDIKRLTGKLRPLVVANQTDLLTDDDELKSTLERMRVRLGFDSATLIGVSSRTALDGLVRNNKKLVRESGWALFLDAFFRMFVPTRHSQRFAMMSSEVLKLVSMTSEQLTQAMKSLRTSESELRTAEESLIRAKEKHDSLSKCHAVWSKCPTTLPTVGQLNGGPSDWLSVRLGECERLLSSIELPDLQSFKHSGTFPKSSQIASLEEQRTRLLSTIDERRAEARAVEAAHFAHTELEAEIRNRRSEFVGRQPIMQSLSFRYRKRLEEDEVSASIQRRTLDQQILAAESEVKNFIQQATSLGVAVTNLVNSSRSLAEGERAKSKQSLDEAERGRAAAHHEVSIRAWARPARDKFEYDLKLKLLAALAQDFALAQHHLA